MSGSTSARGGFSVVISAVDQASKPIDVINKRLAAMRAPVDRVQRSLSRFADLSGISAISRGMEGVARASFAAFENIGRMVSPLGAITGAASVAGLVRMVDSWASFAMQLSLTGQRIGVSVTDLQKLENAGRLVGVSGDTMASGLTKLKDNLTDMVAGRAPEAVAMFNALGVSWRNSDGSARQLSDTLPEIANKIAAIRDPTLQARAAVALFGGAGEAMLPILRQGAAGIARLTEEAQRHGAMTREQADAATLLRRNMVGLTESVEGLQNSIASKLAPVMAPILDQMTRWIDANRNWIATNIGDAVSEFADYVKAIDFATVLKDLGDFAKTANSIAQALGGWQPILEGLFALMAARFAISMIAPFVTLAATIAKIGVSLTSLGAKATGVFTAATTAAAATSEAAAAGAATGAAGGGVATLLSAASLARLATGFGAAAYVMRPSATNTGEADFLRDTRRQQLLNYFTKQGWTPPQAAGIVANFDRESKLREAAIGDNGQAFGIGQWHADRQAVFEQLFGHPMRGSSLQEQAEFAQYELTQGREQAAGEQLRRATSAGEAGAAVSQLYERPRDQAGEAAARAAAAEQLLARFDVPRQPVADPFAIGGAPRAPAAPPAAPPPPRVSLMNETANAAASVRDMAASIASAAIPPAQGPAPTPAAPATPVQPPSPVAPAPPPPPSPLAQAFPRLFGAPEQQKAVSAPSGQPIVVAPAPTGNDVNIRGGAAAPTPPPAPAEQTVRGSANVNIRFQNKPPGTVTTATTDGGLFKGPPKIEDMMYGYGP